MRTYKTDRAILNNYTPRLQPDADTSRNHAINWAAGVGILAFCFYVLGWSILKMWWQALPNWSIALCVPVALAFGATWGSMKLIQFTEEHRDWLYALEEETRLDLNRDGVIGDPVQVAGIPPQGTMIRGTDGQLHQLNTELSVADIHAVKASLLTSGYFGVRAINSLLGDETRASGLRIELYRLGILEKPQPRQATPLTASGKKAVMRWE